MQFVRFCNKNNQNRLNRITVGMVLKLKNKTIGLKMKNYPK